MKSVCAFRLGFAFQSGFVSRLGFAFRSGFVSRAPFESEQTSALRLLLLPHQACV